MPQPFSDVIVLLPGILGSVLKKDGKDVWAGSWSAYLRALVSSGGSVQALDIKDDDPNVEDLGDGVVADRLLSDVHLIPGFWKIDVYSQVASYLKETFGVQAGRNYFEFPYDWRRDNRASARRQARAAHTWLKNWRKESGEADAKLVLIAHSMGGLVSRYFLELLEGWRDTRMLITLGTPYRGSLKALNFLSNGFPKSYGPIPIPDLNHLVRSLTSVYQLLPIYPCVDLGGGKLVRVNETQRIPNLDESRATAALQFHREVQDAVESHEHEDAYLKDRYKVLAIVGTFQETPQSAVLDGSKLKTLPHIAGEDHSGDGTVPRVSAVPIGSGSQTSGRQISSPHSSLQNSDDSLTQIEYWLTGISIDDQRFRAFLKAAQVSLTVEDAYSSEEQVQVRVRCEDPSLQLLVSVFPVNNEETVARRQITLAGEGWTSFEVGKLKPDVYRIEVGGAGVQPARDVFIVLEA